MADSPVREEAARLLANATPGPWEFDADDDGRAFVHCLRGDATGALCSNEEPHYLYPIIDNDIETLRFIAAAPTLVADLLALTASDRSEVEQLRAERDGLRKLMGDFNTSLAEFAADDDNWNASPVGISMLAGAIRAALRELEPLTAGDAPYAPEANAAVTILSSALAAEPVSTGLAPEPEPAAANKVHDLMAALEDSVNAAKSARLAAGASPQAAPEATT